MRVEKFEQLIAWQKARVLTRDVYAATKEKNFARDFGLTGQMQRAAVSVMSNIAEGFERNKSTEFHQFLCMAKGSCGELRSQVYVAYDVGYLDESRFRDLLTKCEEVGRITGALRASVERRRNEAKANSAKEK
jgi:four helix bundle protein